MSRVASGLPEQGMAAEPYPASAGASTSRSISTLRALARGSDRRAFLRLAATAGAYLTAGADGLFAAEPMPCTPGFENGEFLGVEPFADTRAVLGVRSGAGLTGLLLYDLAELSETNLVTPNDQFYIRTMYPDLIDPSLEWTVRIHGLVRTERVLTMEDLLPATVDQGVHLLECSGNSASGAFGLLSAAHWSGVPVRDVLDMVTPSPEATRVLISGFDEHSSAPQGSVPGASWVFTMDELAESFFAVQMNGAPLPADHGRPIRLFNPGWYGCTCIKWVNEIVLVDDDVPATSQMQEFAARTHQAGVSDLARDYIPATLDTAAMPVRIERWRVDGVITRRIMGIVWGGADLHPPLSIGIRVEAGEQRWEPVYYCPAREHSRTWGLWWHAWTPAFRGLYSIDMDVDDVAIRTRRLDSGWYRRTVNVRSV